MQLYGYKESDHLVTATAAASRLAPQLIEALKNDKNLLGQNKLSN